MSVLIFSAVRRFHATVGALLGPIRIEDSQHVEPSDDYDERVQPRLEGHAYQDIVSAFT